MRRNTIIFIVSALALVLCFAFLVMVIRDQRSEPGKEDSPGFLSEPSGPLPPLPEQSKFLSELDRESHPELAPPDQPQLLAWDFSRAKVYGYRLQVVTQAKSSFQNLLTTDQAIELSGKILIKSQGDQSADLVIKDLEMTMEMGMAAGKSKATTSMPTRVIQGIPESGAGVSGEVGDLVDLDYLFLLPREPLSLGESYELPLSKDLNASGSRMKAKGRAVVTLDKYVEINGHACARLVTDFEISDLEPPAEMEGTWQALIKGRSVFYFDTIERCFVEGRTAILVALRVEAPLPKMKFSAGESIQLKMPEKMRMVIDTDTLITVERNSNLETASP